MKPPEKGHLHILIVPEMRVRLLIFSTEDTVDWVDILEHQITLSNVSK